MLAEIKAISELENKIDQNTLGGANTHTSISGTADYFAKDDITFKEVGYWDPEPPPPPLPPAPVWEHDHLTLGNVRVIKPHSKNKGN